LREQAQQAQQAQLARDQIYQQSLKNREYLNLKKRMDELMQGSGIKIPEFHQ
jgi:hypothetical protein